ncbi:MAG: PF00070 family, FAD-dependent NAD(P)-disulfide oxidoreductase [Ktedonobacterales bacterium]|nr:MAG: PF00070 family, FAD-dependent NAD(P)-disulfide oxidoreductase [Ktedonobacterales bacterium]
MMADVQSYDAIIIGAGQAGMPLSMALARAGRRTAIIESTHVGGTCINEGCTPTKTMIASGRVAYLARRGADYGVHTGALSVDMVKVRQRKRDIVNSFCDGDQRRIEDTPGVDLIFGEASFIAPKTLAVQGNDGTLRHLSAPTILINAGARPSTPNLPGLDTVSALNSTSIMELDTVPEHLLVLGGGYVGLEFGQLFRRLGSRVTIIQRRTHLLAREDDDVAEAVADILRQDGIEILLNSSATRVAQDASGAVALRVMSPAGERTLTGSHLLVAVGRMPNSDRLNLPAAGIMTDSHGFIHANDKLETSVPGIYALGDVKGGPAFTHISYDDFRIIRTNLIEGGNTSIAGRLVPYTVFIDPQLGRVGLTEREAREQGANIIVAKMPMNYVARALEVDEARGFMKAIVDRDSKQILGAAILGIEGGEIMAMLEIAMLGKLPYTTLRDAVFAHPTLAEALNNLFTSIER